MELVFGKVLEDIHAPSCRLANLVLTIDLDRRWRSRTAQLQMLFGALCTAAFWLGIRWK